MTGLIVPVKPGRQQSEKNPQREQWRDRSEADDSSARRRVRAAGVDESNADAVRSSSSTSSRVSIAMTTSHHPYSSRLFHTPLNSVPPWDVVPVMRQVQPTADCAQATPPATPDAVVRPVATIVIPAWNAWEHTERCLQSLRPTLGADDHVVDSIQDVPDKSPRIQIVD